MLIDYWLAGSAARAWRRLLRKGPQPGGGDMPGLCGDVSRGQGSALPAGTLWRVQDFAMTVWWVTCMVAVVTGGVAGLALKAAYGAVPVSVVSLGVMSVFLFVLGVTVALVIIGYIRRNWITLYMRKGGGAVRSRPLPSGSVGLPRRWDFWLAVSVGVVMVAISVGGLSGG